MEIKLETIEDVEFFKNNWTGIYNHKGALEPVKEAEVIISAKLLAVVINEYEALVGDAEANYYRLSNELYVKNTNLIEEWIESNIELNEDKTEEEIRKNCLNTVRKELANLKSEKDLDSVDLIKYNFLYMTQDCFNLEPEAIIEKIEKDLAELEVPVNDVGEEPVKAK